MTADNQGQDDSEMRNGVRMKWEADGKPGTLWLPWRSAAGRIMIRNGLLIVTWYTLSTVLSLFNKKLVGRNAGVFGNQGFPAPLFLSAVQFLFQFLLAKVVFKLGLLQRTAPKPLSREDFLKFVLPNGVTTGLDVGFSMKSLVYITISFYTMCKSTVPVFLLLFAFAFRLERPSMQLAGVVSVITSGLVLLVRGETEFELIGFVMVMAASAFSGFRFALTQISLQGHHEAAALGSPLEVLELLTPIMSVTVLVLSLVWENLFVVIPQSAYFNPPSHAAASVGIIALGAVIAFLMVWTEYKVIKETSALTFMIAGTVKEVVSVIAAILVMGDHFSPMNGVGLGVVICGVALFNYHKWQKMKAERSASEDLGAAMELAPRKGTRDRGAGEHEALLANTDERSVGTSTSINMHAASPTHLHLLSQAQLPNITVAKIGPGAQASLFSSLASGNGKQRQLDLGADSDHDLHMTVGSANAAHVQLMQHALYSGLSDQEQGGGKAQGASAPAPLLPTLELGGGVAAAGASHGHGSQVGPVRTPTAQQQQGMGMLQRADSVEGRGVQRLSNMGQAAAGPSSSEALGGAGGLGASGGGELEDMVRSQGTPAKPALGLLARLGGGGVGGADGGGARGRPKPGGTEHEPLLKNA